jgi:hypothetical protein
MMICLKSGTSGRTVGVGSRVEVDVGDGSNVKIEVAEGATVAILPVGNTIGVAGVQAARHKRRMQQKRNAIFGVMTFSIPALTRRGGL